MTDRAPHEGKPAILVRPFRDQDAWPLADLMMEMVRFYGATIDPKLVIAEDLRHQSTTMDIIVAEGPEGMVAWPAEIARIASWPRTCRGRAG